MAEDMLDSLPMECLVRIFSLMTIVQAARLARVCRAFAVAARHSLSQRDSLWLVYTEDGYEDKDAWGSICTRFEKSMPICGVDWKAAYDQTLQRLTLKSLHVLSFPWVPGHHLFVDASQRLIRSNAASLVDLNLYHSGYALPTSDGLSYPRLRRLWLDDFRVLTSDIVAACPSLRSLNFFLQNDDGLRSLQTLHHLRSIGCYRLFDDFNPTLFRLQHVQHLTIGLERLLPLNQVLSGLPALLSLHLVRVDISSEQMTEDMTYLSGHQQQLQRLGLLWTSSEYDMDLSPLLLMDHVVDLRLDMRESLVSLTAVTDFLRRLSSRQLKHFACRFQWNPEQDTPVDWDDENEKLVQQVNQEMGSSLPFTRTRYPSFAIESMRW